MNTIADKKHKADLLAVKRSLAELRRERLEFDKRQAAFENEIKRDRLAFGKSQAASERKFWQSPAGTRATAFVSGVAALVTLTIGASSVWVSKITKDKEIEVSRIQKQVELDKLDVQKKREWDLSLAQFVLTNQKAIFNGTPQEQKVLAKIIPTIFPEDVSVALLERLEKASPAPTKVIWSQARTNLETADQTSQANETGHVDIPSVPASRPSVGLVSSSIDSAVPFGRFGERDESHYSFPSVGVAGSRDIQTILNNIADNREIRNQLFPSAKLDGAPTEVVPIYSLGRPLGVPISPDNKGLLFTDTPYKPIALGGVSVLTDLSKVSALDFSLATKGPDSVISPSLISIASAPPSTSISGTIIDGETGAPIAQATIELRAPYLTVGETKVTTDVFGRFRIEIPIGSRYTFVSQLQLRIASTGYRPATKDLPIAGSLPVYFADIRLEKETRQ